MSAPAAAASRSNLDDTSTPGISCRVADPSSSLPTTTCLMNTGTCEAARCPPQEALPTTRCMTTPPWRVAISLANAPRLLTFSVISASAVGSRTKLDSRVGVSA